MVIDNTLYYTALGNTKPKLANKLLNKYVRIVLVIIIMFYLELIWIVLQRKPRIIKQ